MREYYSNEKLGGPQGSIPFSLHLSDIRHIKTAKMMIIFWRWTGTFLSSAFYVLSWHFAKCCSFCTFGTLYIENLAFTQLCLYMKKYFQP